MVMGKMHEESGDGNTEEEDCTTMPIPLMVIVETKTMLNIKRVVGMVTI